MPVVAVREAIVERGYAWTVALSSCEHVNSNDFSLILTLVPVFKVWAPMFTTITPVVGS